MLVLGGNGLVWVEKGWMSCAASAHEEDRGFLTAFMFAVWGRSPLGKELQFGLTYTKFLWLERVKGAA